MALQVKNAPGQAGYVLLVFDQDIAASPLRLAICNRISRTYLGHSVGKANWSPARSHFFDAVLVSRGGGETVFKVGPEVTTFIPDETTVELTSEDGAVREVTVWRSVLLDFHWRGPDVNPDDEARRLREEENLRRERNEAERRRRETEAERQRRAAEDEEQRKLAAEAEKARKQAAADWQRKNAEDGRKQIEARAAEAERMRREAETTAEAERQRRAAEDDEKRKLAADAAEAEKARQLASADWRRKEAGEEAARLAAIAADTEKPREDDEVEKQRKEAEEWEEKKRREEEAKPNQEKDDALPENLIALGDEGKKERARAYKGMAAVFAAIAALWIVSWGLEHGSEVCIWSGLFCERTVVQPAVRPAVQPATQADRDSDRAAFERARTCAEGKSCGVADCVAEYRRVYPDGLFKREIDVIVVGKGLSCPVDFEKDVYDRAAACASVKTCEANGCLAEYRRLYPNGRFKSQLDRISAAKGSRARGRGATANAKSMTAPSPVPLR